MLSYHSPSDVSGAFMTGSSSSYNATSLVSRSIELGSPIIYVSLNYRVNGQPFVSTVFY